MIANPRRFLNASTNAATALVGLLLASCVAQQPTAPQEVQASNPSVTYKYHSDQELIQTNQSAATFCSTYHAGPRASHFANDPDGSKVVVYECLQTAMQPAPQPRFDPGLTYSYRTDQDLLDASRNAQTYCMNNGSQQVVSNFGTGADGSRTVNFRCSSR
ncbi:MAG TPA: hypothetical protein VM689_03250 [Aliidongia sp.]|nr:hypothetical protein [Aliidongia sp.]